MSNKNLVHLNRDEIDDTKWDQLIKISVNSRFYAFTWYLDTISEKAWSALIFGDYDAVFPIFVKNKYLVPYVSPPYLCQQLGLFAQTVDVKIYSELIIRYMKTNFFKTDLFINSNFFENQTLKPRQNHCLNLNKSYNLLYTDYNRNTKRNLAYNDELLNEIYESKDVNKFLEFLLKFDKSEVLITIQDKLAKLVNYTIKNETGKIIICKDEEEILAAAFYIEDIDRIYFILCASSTEGTKRKTMYVLIDYLINKFAESNKILDFTGSSMENIARRNEGFGAIKETYYHLKTYWNPF